MLRPRAQKPTAHPQQQVNQTEEYAESPRRARRSRKTKVESEGSRDDVHQIVGWVKMRTQQSRRGEASDANDHKNNTQDLTNCLCHDYSFSSCENQSKPFADKHRKATLAAHRIARCFGNGRIVLTLERTVKVFSSSHPGS